jgi:two-component system KDP operon response regulator KdpE
MASTVLVIDDEPQILRALRINLSVRGYDVTVAATGAEALKAAAEHKPDVVILDLGLPDMSGIDVLAGLRGWLTAPVIVLSARTDSMDKVEALDAGADDYLTKPFALAELEARVRALLRRHRGGGEPQLRCGRLVLDEIDRCAYSDGAPLDLSARELGVLELLLQRAGRVVTKAHLLEQLYDWDQEVGANAVEVCVHRLRRKLLGAGVSIRAIRGLGYVVEALTDA